MTSPKRLRPVEIFDIPVQEASALAVVHRDGTDVLVAVGDKNATMASAPLRHGAPGSWQTVDLTALFKAVGTDGAQLEAAAADGLGNVVLAQEEPSRLFVVNASRSKITHVLDLDASTDDMLAESWGRDENSRVESIVLGPDGQVLVVKEKKPICLALFAPSPVGMFQLPDGPPEDWTATLPAQGTLAAVASWRAGKSLQRLGDISDAAVGPDGSLFALSDQSASIARLDVLPEPGGKVGVAEAWEIEGWPDKCEGLAFDSEGYCYVALDSPKGEKNLLVFDHWRAA